MEIPDNILLFYGGIYSQWYSCYFKVDGYEFNCAEQYMMAEKANYFHDNSALRKILSTNDPGEQKSIGRRVCNFSESEWNKIARLVVYRGNLAKFSQNYNLYKELLSTGNKIIVEASPTDKIWGIGLSKHDPSALDPTKWKGFNWLGKAIMQVRSDLRQLGLDDKDKWMQW